MAKHATHKDNNKFETIARRAHRAAKYANASRVSKSGRTSRIAKVS